MSTLEKTSPKILLFPFLGQGHLNPFFELAKTLSNHNFVVYFCSTPVNLKSFERKLDGCSVRQVKFHLPSSHELPPHYHTTTDLPPHLVSSLDEVYRKFSPSIFSDILKSVQPDLVIHDICQSWLPPIVASYRIPSVYFQTSSAANQSYLMHSVKQSDLQFPSTTTFYREHELNCLKRVEPPTTEDTDEDFGHLLFNWIWNSHDITLIRTSKSFEEKYIDFESILVDKKVVFVGSLVSEPEDDDNSEIIQWLNGKEEASTVYVAFRSEASLTKAEMKEIGIGLEISNVNFIWIVRSPYAEKTKFEELMPNGFLNRIKGKGFFEYVWAPQTKILKHPSIGAFVSHCRWGSVLESISFGVPIILMPMKAAQHLNARLVAELGVGLEVVGEKYGVRKGEELGRIIEEVILKDNGEMIRKKSRKLGKKLRVKSKEEVDVAIQELRNIC